MSPRTVVPAALSALLLAATLSGCGGSSDDDTPSLEAGIGYDPATGPTVKGDGYSLHTVSGWRDVTSQAKQNQPSIDKAYAAAKPIEGFAPNVNVIVMSGGSGEPTKADFDKGEKRAVSELKGVGATNIHVQPRLNLDDETALHVTATAKSGAVSYNTDQYFAVHDGKSYVITYSVPAGLQEPQANALTNPSIASFRWS